MYKNEHGLEVPVSNEEVSVMNLVEEAQFVSAYELNERQMELADRLVKRGILECDYVQKVPHYSTVIGAKK